MIITQIRFAKKLIATFKTQKFPNPRYTILKSTHVECSLWAWQTKLGCVQSSAKLCAIQLGVFLTLAGQFPLEHIPELGTYN